MMTVSTKARYAMRILVYMATREGKVAKKSEISKAEGVSEAYVEQILVKLRTAGLVRSIRGMKGGFLTDRDPKTLTALEVLMATEGSLSLAPCHEKDCNRATSCTTQGMWEQATEAMMKVFRETTIAQLATEAIAKRDRKAMSFDI